MKVEVIGKNGFIPSEANKEYASKKLTKLDHFFDQSQELVARVVCNVYRDCHKVEITIPAKNVVLRAEVSEQDLYAAIDKTIDKLVTQMRKHKSRVKNKMGKEPLSNVFAEEEEDFDEETLEREFYASSIVRSKQIDLQPLSLEEALTQMELLGHDFFIYQDKETSKTHVLYLRDDGDYAVIQTN